TGMRRYCYNLDNSVDRKLREMYPGQRPRKDNGDQRNPPKRLEVMKNQQQPSTAVAQQSRVPGKAAVAREKARGNRPRSTSIAIPTESSARSAGSVNGGRRQSWTEQQRGHVFSGPRYEGVQGGDQSGHHQQYAGHPLLHPPSLLMPPGSYPGPTAAAAGNRNNASSPSTVVGPHAAAPTLHSSTSSVQGHHHHAAPHHHHHPMMVMNYHQQQEGLPATHAAYPG
ncbi:hypothetical protein FOZ63_018274, partial [Perkinsus olseni]